MGATTSGDNLLLFHLWPREVALGLADATTVARRSRDADPVNLQLRQEVELDKEEVSLGGLFDEVSRG